jgi:subtilisin family serine protease
MAVLRRVLVLASVLWVAQGSFHAQEAPGRGLTGWTANTTAATCDIVVYGFETATFWLAAVQGLFMPIEGLTGGKPAYRKGAYYLYYTAEDFEWNIGTSLGSGLEVWVFIGSNASHPGAIPGRWNAAFGATKHINDGPANTFSGCKPCDVIVSDPDVTGSDPTVQGMFMATHRGFSTRFTYRNEHNLFLFWSSGRWSIGDSVGADAVISARSSSFDFYDVIAPEDPRLTWSFRVAGSGEGADATYTPSPLAASPVQCEDQQLWGGITDPAYSLQTWYHNAINVTGVWKMGITGLGVQIMVNDDGVDYNHDEFKDKFVMEDSIGDPIPFDADSHGTRYPTSA